MVYQNTGTKTKQKRQHSLVAEPVGDGGTSLQTPSELSARYVESLNTLGHLVLRDVLVSRGHIGHLLERHHLDLELVAELGDEVLCVVGTVEVLALRVLAWASVVTADDEVRRTKVLADDGVPDGLTRTSHAHGKRQEREVAHAVGVSGHDGLIHTHTGVVVDVTGLGETHDGVDEYVGLALSGSEHGELTVSAVHGVTGLEGDDLAPSELGEVGSQLSGCIY